MKGGSALLTDGEKVRTGTSPSGPQRATDISCEEIKTRPLNGPCGAPDPAAPSTGGRGGRWRICVWEEDLRGLHADRPNVLTLISHLAYVSKTSKFHRKLKSVEGIWSTVQPHAINIINDIKRSLRADTISALWLSKPASSNIKVGKKYPRHKSQLQILKSFKSLKEYEFNTF